MAEELIGQAKVVVQSQEGDSLKAHHDDLQGVEEAISGLLASQGDNPMGVPPSQTHLHHPHQALGVVLKDG